ncbi:MAG: hypothetical protein HQ567_26890 [Candidatus Nealsonbacteria bacterium]|nr:hypothetical protein [Candidatus Nealsonbacteria bacterium]
MKKSSRYRVRSQPAKSPGIALVLSFFWPGLGQLYVGDLVKGLLMMFLLPTVALIVILLTGETGYYVACAVSICIWIYGMFDAYTSAERYNRQRR